MALMNLQRFFIHDHVDLLEFLLLFVFGWLVSFQGIKRARCKIFRISLGRRYKRERGWIVPQERQLPVEN